MEEFDLLLADRLGVIKQFITKQGPDKFYLSFSGGKDSTILHYLLDEALPGNNIPRVYIDTGIEYNDIREFVYSLAEKDSRIKIIKPTTPIKKTLEQYGYPFKSKEHSLKIGQWQKGSKAKSIISYKEGDNAFSCPKILKYQFEPSFKIKLSNKCCYLMKKQPIKKWEKENNRSISIIGLRQEEGGERRNHKACIVTDESGKVIRFKPLNPVPQVWEDQYIERRNIKLCRLYYPPFNFKRTGCKGCPYSLELQEQLSVMSVYLPKERLQCEIIWAPIYAEYRKIGYRLEKKEQLKLF